MTKTATQQIDLSQTHHDGVIWGLSWVSLCTSMASLMVFSILPIYMTQVMGLKNVHVGLIEGLSIGSAFIIKLFAGGLSDYVGRRKPFILLGAALTILTKSMFAFASTLWVVIMARMLDRQAKGLRAAPLEAMIGDYSPNKRSGYYFGLRQSLYSAGAVLGAFAAWVCLQMGLDFLQIFQLAVIPAIVAFIIAGLTAKDAPKKALYAPPMSWAQHRQNMHVLGWPFVFMLCISSLLMMARFSESFLVLRAVETGWTIVQIPLMTVAMDLVHAGVAVYFGRKADHMSKATLLWMAMIVLAVANLVFIFVPTFYGTLAAVLIVGLHMGMSQGVLFALVSDAAEPRVRGTAFGLWHLTTGLVLILGNTWAGFLNDLVGGHGAFLSGFVFTGLSLILLTLKTSRLGK